MIARRLLLSSALAFCCATQFAVAGDDSEVQIYSKGTDRVKWVWSAKQSRLAALPEWDPNRSDPPVTPHQAVMAGREFLQNRLSVYVPLIIFITLSRIGLEPNAVTGDIWAYTLVFDSQKPSEDEQPLLQVLVLMDGKVVVPVKQPAR